MAPATHVIVHHEGAGAPTNNVERMGHQRYSIVIGTTTYALRYPPEQSFRTTEYSRTEHPLQLGLTGNREVYGVTDADLELVRRAMAEARAQGWVIDHPTVTFHGDHQATACPGRNAQSRRADLVAACQAPVPLVNPAISTGAKTVALRVADPARPGTPAGRTRFAQLVPGHGVALVNGARVSGDTGPTIFGTWLLLGAAKDIAEELVAVPGGFIVALADGGTYGPYMFKD